MTPRYRMNAIAGEQETTGHPRSPSYTKLREDRCLTHIGREGFARASLEFAPSVKMNLKNSDVSHQVIAWTGLYELAVTKRLSAIARRGGLLLDVGANYGYYTCLWAAADDANRVIAFDVVP